MFALLAHSAAENPGLARSDPGMTGLSLGSCSSQRLPEPFPWPGAGRAPVAPRRAGGMLRLSFHRASTCSSLLEGMEEMEPSGPGFEALPSILPGPEMQNATGLGLVFPPASACIECWRKISFLLLWLWREEFWKHLEKCNTFSLSLLSWPYIHFVPIFSCFYLGLCQFSPFQASPDDGHEVPWGSLGLLMAADPLQLLLGGRSSFPAPPWTFISAWRDPCRAEGKALPARSSHPKGSVG